MCCWHWSSGSVNHRSKIHVCISYFWWSRSHTCPSIRNFRFTSQAWIHIFSSRTRVCLVRLFWFNHLHIKLQIPQIMLHRHHRDFTSYWYIQQQQQTLNRSLGLKAALVLNSNEKAKYSIACRRRRDNGNMQFTGSNFPPSKHPSRHIDWSAESHLSFTFRFSMMTGCIHDIKFKLRGHWILHCNVET